MFDDDLRMNTTTKGLVTPTLDGLKRLQIRLDSPEN
jgi:hypothetical protein